MCGLVALINAEQGVAPSLLNDMCQTIAHRGPDGEGFVLFNENNAWPMIGPNAPQGGESTLKNHPNTCVGFGHRRLSIIDMSSAGHQPMADSSGRLWVTYNGEIYNFIELRKELEKFGHIFSSHSDTEVLLAAWMQWGPDCLSRLNGMFAIVLYDMDSQKIYAIRDRFGVKPLYWWRTPEGSVAFASEIKAFSVLPGWQATLNNQRGYDFLVWGLMDHTQETLFEGVQQIAPGGIIVFNVAAPQASWQSRLWYEPRPSYKNVSDFEAASIKFKTLFEKSVEMRLRADVPVGTALSGGLDSSSIVCTVHNSLKNNDKTSRHAFSARAKGADFDEGSFMEAVTEQTQVNHHQVWPDADGFLSTLPQMIWHHDEPFGSGSIYAEWCVFESVADTSVKVTLDGHGADETLVGYTAFIGTQMASLARQFKFRTFIKEWQAQRQLHNRPALWLLAMLVDNIAPKWLRSFLRKLSGHTHTTPDWIDLSKLRVMTTDPFEKIQARGTGILGMSIAQLKGTSLPMQFKWADRNSMAHSIESREPFLDVELVEFILGLPDDFKLKDAISKRVLREGLKDVLPKIITERKDKMGFVTPESLWVTRDNPKEFLKIARRAIEASQGILTPKALKDAEDIIERRIPFNTRLFRMIVFGAWIERFGVKIQ